MVIYKKPIKILHILKNLGRGGVELWLVNVLKRIDRRKFIFDFLVHDNQPKDYDEEVKALGSEIIYFPYPIPPWTYYHKLKMVLKKYGPYQIIHAHQALCGYVLLMAKQQGVPILISHSHQDDILRLKDASLWRRLAVSLSQRLIYRYASGGLAASQKAALARYGPRWQSDPRWKILYCGIDLTPFLEPVNRREVRHFLGIPDNAWVVGNVGRLATQKNHALMLDIAVYLAREVKDFRMVMVGDGPLRLDLEKKVAQKGLGEKVILAGSRGDVPRILRGAMDVFLFPSFFEGLGLALVEAQAAGLPCVVADTLPEEAVVVSDLVTRLSLDETPERWAAALLSTRNQVRMPEPTEAFRQVEQSRFNIDFSVRELTEFYLDLMKKRHV